MRRWPLVSLSLSLLFLVIQLSKPLILRDERSGLPTRLLVSEIAGESGSAVAITHCNDLAIDLDEHSVSKGFASAEWCAYKPAMTERRIDRP